MELWRKYTALCLLFLFFSLSACKKSEVDTRRFMKQGRWGVTQLEIGSTSFSMFPKWEIEHSEDATLLTPGTWIHDDGTQAKFCWRFNYFSGTFTMALDKNVVQSIEEKAYQQCKNLSGDYEVITDKRNLFEFQSTETVGYPGVRVFIAIEPL